MALNSIENQVAMALPTQFEFYDQGTVGQDSGTAVDLPVDCIGVAFSVYPMNDKEGDQGFRSVLLAVFDEGLDSDMYVEMGNIIASRFATRMSENLSETLVITPPLMLKTPAVQRLVRLKKQLISTQRYVHLHQNHAIPVQVYVLQVANQELGHA